MQTLRISVSEILGRPGRHRDLVIDAAVPGVATALAHLDQEPAHAELRLEAVVEGILVTGSVAAPMALECARCLESFSAPLEVQVCELYAGPGHEDPLEEDAYEVEDGVIDLKPMLRDALTLELPLHPLCRPDCQGYCPRCGADLNAGPCSCDDEEIDERWAALSALREKLG